MADIATRVCLVTTGQPACNPRLVKEADALVDAGFDVHVVAAYSADWATDADRELAGSRRWSQTFVDWRLTSAPWMFWKSRVRHTAARLTAPWLRASSAAEFAVSRIAPELRRAATEVHADLYIAHNLGRAAGGLAGVAAARRKARIRRRGLSLRPARASIDRLRPVVERVERRYLPACDYITASSPGIAEAYRSARGWPGRLASCSTCFQDDSAPASRRRACRCHRCHLYWFSQTIGPGRGLEDIVRAHGTHARGFDGPAPARRLVARATNCRCGAWRRSRASGRSESWVIRSPPPTR